MKRLTTEAIERVAARLGVPIGTIRQWRRRGVPAAQRIAIVTRSRGKVALRDFPKQDETK